MLTICKYYIIAHNSIFALEIYDAYSSGAYRLGKVVTLIVNIWFIKDKLKKKR